MLCSLIIGIKLLSLKALLVLKNLELKCYLGI